MKKMRPIKKILLALGVAALAVGGTMLTTAKPVFADDADATEAHLLLPGFTENGQSNPFNTNPNATNINATNLNTYNSLEMSFGSGQDQAWSNGADVTFDHNWTMSFWTLVGKDDGSTINDGMALVFQPNANNTTIKTKDGQSLGVYGYADSTMDSTSTVAKRAIQKSVAIEFDNHVNSSYNSTDGFDYYQKSSKHIALTYPGSSSNYGTVGAFIGAGAYYINHSNVINMASGYQWRHVTIVYTDNPYNKTSGTLSYFYDDRDRITNQPKAVSEVRNASLDFTKMNGKSSTYYFGFTSYDKAGGVDTSKNRVILDTFSDYLTTKASAKLVDHTLDDAEVTTGSKVYGGDELHYTYTITNNSTSARSLDSAMLQTALPDPTLIDWQSASVTTSTGQTSALKVADIQSNTGANVAAKLAAGESATVTVIGKANSVTDVNGKKVAATDWQFKNGGAESYLLASDALTNPTNYGSGTYLEKQQQTPQFTIMPGVITSTSGSVKDLTEVGSPEVAQAHVFVGDELGYSFQLDYDAKKSVIDWNDTIDATIDMPDSLKYANLAGTATIFQVKTTDDAGNVIYQNSYTAAQIEAGAVAVTDANGLTRNPVRDHITVTVTAVFGGNIDTTTTVPAATAVFANAQHKDTATTPSFTVTAVNSNREGRPVLSPDATTLQVDQVGDAYEGENSVNLTGSFTDADVTNNNQISMYVEVEQRDAQGQRTTGSVKHLQLTAGTDKKYNLSLLKPTTMSTMAAFNDATVPSTTGQAVDTSVDSMLKYGVNYVYLFAVDQKGRASDPVEIVVNVGLFKFMKATDITFPTTTLTGTQHVVGADNAPTLMINNSLGNQWNVTATATAFTAGNKTLKGSLYYVNSDGEDVVLNDQSAAITDSSLLSTKSDNNYNVDLSSGWNQTQTNANTISQVKQPGLYVELNAGATAETDAYKSAITWTLTDAPK